MRLNNKGFAITAVLYGLLILFVILVSSYLLVLSAKKDRIDNLVSEIESEYMGEKETENSNPINLKDYIRSLYQNGNPMLITHSKDDGTSDKYYYSYQDDSKTWGLMNDGLKVSDTFGAGATAISDETILKNGTEGNIRYFGPSDKVNNYIYFNCETYPSTNCEKWRIIGIVDGKVKIIRNDSIGNLAWDHDKNQGSTVNEYSNNWETSSLQLMLNSSYYYGNTSGTITYYSENEGKTAIDLDMSIIGIKNDVTRQLISESIWYLGGNFKDDMYPNDVYHLERTYIEGTTIYGTNPYTIDANIGLMYPSDHGYASDLSKCSYKISQYGTTESDPCKINNWLMTSETIINYWCITPTTGNFSFFNGISAWNPFYGGVIGHVYYAYDVYPVLYLNSKLVIESGHKGTSADPFRIIVS